MANPLVTCRVCGDPIPDFYLIASEETKKGLANANATVATEVPGPEGLCPKHRGNSEA